MEVVVERVVALEWWVGVEESRRRWSGGCGLRGISTLPSRRAVPPPS